MNADDLPIVLKLWAHDVPNSGMDTQGAPDEAADIIRGLYNGCNAMLGLIRLLAANPNTPPALLRILTESHRIAEAENAVAKARGEQVSA